jgi:fibronectin-binding autotransporter adhesin
MATKTITGTITGGYILQQPYSTLSITSTGEILGATGVGESGARPAGAGGAGLTLNFAATLEGDGVIIGGVGGQAGSGYGGAGGAGVFVAAGVSVTSTGLTITGGLGGYSSWDGGVGGAGVYLAAGASLTEISGSITGGRGGTNADRAVQEGGAGVELSSRSHLLMEDGTITGGQGGENDRYYDPVAGGAGVFLSSGASLMITGGTIIGGQGDVFDNYGRPGSGGAGVFLEAGAGLETTGGVISGGAGFDGGRGGVGLVAYARLTTSGTIIGGVGGRGGRSAKYGGAGGDGVIATLALTTAGTITGGAGGVGSVGGGSGGAGVSVLAGGTMTVTGGKISGGAGGAAGVGGARGGGSGGLGVNLVDARLIVQAGTIVGGAGHSGMQGGDGGLGVFLGGGSLTNVAGTISGGAGGVSKSGANGSAGDGVDLDYSPAVVINGNASHHTALIRGLIGISVSATGTVTNFATIEGTGGTSVDLTSADDRIIVESDSVFIGAVAGGGATLELAGRNGTIAGLGATGVLSGAETMTFSAFGTYEVDAGGAWTLASADVLVANQTLTNAGTMTGTLALGAASDRVILESGGQFRGMVTGGGGTLELDGGSGAISGLGATAIVSGAEVGTFSGVGSYAIDAGGAWTLAGTNVLAAGQTLTNAGTLSGTLGLGAASDRVVLESGGVFAGVVNGGHGSLELAAESGTISGLGATATVSGAEAGTFSGFGSYDIDAHASWALAGIDLLAARQTLTNAGTMTGTLGLDAASDRIILETGGVFSGLVNGGAGTLELAGGTGIITGLGATATVYGAAAGTFSGFGSYVIDAGGSWTLHGNDVVAAGHTLVNRGELDIWGAGSLTVAGVVVGPVVCDDLGSSGGTLIVKAGSSVTGLVSGDDGALELAGGAGTITGLGAVATLSGADAMTFTGFGSIAIDADASWTVTGVGSLSYFESLSNAGSLTFADGARLALGSAVYNSGTIFLDAKKSELIVVQPFGVRLSGGGSVILGADALDMIAGGSLKATLTNVDNTISGSGQIGHAKMGLINETAGVIEQTGTMGLTIDTGADTITNAGTIEATGAGGLTISSAVANTGVLAADGGNLTLGGAVTGVGTAMIDGAALEADSLFTQNVTFSGTTGELELALSQVYTGTISGFSDLGATSLDLRDVGFVGASEATFSGTKAGGVLTVTDGSHTARIALAGDYMDSTFTASSDGAGGVAVADSVGPPMSPHLFVAAMAGFASPAGTTFLPATGRIERMTLLAVSHTQIP